MAGKKTNIEVILSARDLNMSSLMTKGQAAVKAFSREVSGSGGAITSMRTQVLQLVGAFAGLSAIGEIGAMLKMADQNAYGLAASIQAANREFAVGSAGEWEATIEQLSQKLRIYSQSDIKGAAARTIDMTKRLGLNAEQMKKIIELSGDLAAGRTTLEGGVERVTAALRGEAESAEFLGLTLNENYVKAWYAAHEAHGVAWKDLDDIQKAQVRYNVFLEQAIPLQGKSAESINTWSGALAYIKTTVADSIGSNEDLLKSLTNVSAVLRDNAGEIGKFAATLASGAAAVIEFVARNRELIIDIAKYGGLFLLATSAIIKITAAVRGLNAAFAAMTGLGVVSWLQQIMAAGNNTSAGLLLLRTVFIRLSVATASFFAAYKAGEWITMRDSIKGIADATAELERNAKKVAGKFAEISKETGLTITSMEQLDQAVREGQIHYDQLTGTWKKGSSEQQAATKQSASTMKQATGEALEAMKKKYQEYATEVRRLQDEIAGRERSLASELRGLARTGMSDVSAWQDQKKEAIAYEAAAKKSAQAARDAMTGGDTITAGQKWKEAVGFADEAKQAYTALNKEVKSGETVVVSQQQALKAAMDGVKSAGETAIAILKDQQDAQKSAMENLTSASGFADLTAGMDAAEKQWLENWKNMKDFAGEQILYVEEKIDAMVKDRHVTVYVTEKIQKATGGLIQRFARGGKLSGYGGGDRISALLEAGEFVVRKEAVAKFGSGIFHALNNLRLPEIPRFALGGPVGFAAGGPVAPPSGYSSSFQFTDHSGQQGAVHGSEIDIRRLEAAINKHNRFRSSNR